VFDFCFDPFFLTNICWLGTPTGTPSVCVNSRLCSISPFDLLSLIYPSSSDADSRLLKLGLIDETRGKTNRFYLLNF